MLAAVWLCCRCTERSSAPATACASPLVIPTSSSNGDGQKASAWPAASHPGPTSLILTTQKLSQRPVSISTRWPLQRWPQQRHQAGGICFSSLQDFATGPFLGANGGRPALRLCCHQRQGDGGSTIWHRSHCRRSCLLSGSSSRINRSGDFPPSLF